MTKKETISQSTAVEEKKENKFLCIIPAKEKSRRLPNKNFLEFNGKPMVAWAILIAKQAGLEKIVVSTDSNNSSFMTPGLKVDIEDRPEELCEDDVDSWEVAMQIATLEKYKDFNSIVLLQATSPLLSPKMLKKALDIFTEKKLSCLISISPDAKFSGNFIIIDKKILLKHETVWVPGLWAMMANYGDIDDLSDFRVLEAIQKGHFLDYTREV